MSRFKTTGIHPKTGNPVNIAYGYDSMPAFKPGFFFQVFSEDPEDLINDSSGEGMIVNEGFMNGIDGETLTLLAHKWGAKNFKIPEKIM